MKQLLKILLACVFVLCGCTTKTNTSTNEKIEEYETYYDIIMSNTNFTDSSDNFHIALEMSQVPDGTYRYAIVVDDPKIVMNDVIMMAVMNDIPYEESEQMMPTLGIFEDTNSLVPNQVNLEQGIAKGLAMSGESDSDSITLKILVQYQNAKRTQKTSEFFSFHLDTQGYTYQPTSKE